MTNKDFIAEPFRCEDFENWSRMWSDYVENYEPVAKVKGILESNWRAIIEESEGLRALSLRECLTKKSIGFALYLIHHCTKSARPECDLIDLYVAPDYRGRGAGKFLLEQLVAECKLKGIYRVKWYARKTNPDSQEFYKKFAQGKEWMRYVVIVNNNPEK